MRLELSNRVDLARRALESLSSSGAAKGADLAERLGTTPHYLPHVMRPLVSMGWVSSETGPNGGYRITPGADRANLRDLIEAVDGPTDDGTCALDGAECTPREPCPMHRAWSRARRVMLDELRRTPVLRTKRR